MNAGTEIRSRRKRGDITGNVLALAASIDRSRLSKIECGYITPSPAEVKRVLSTLDRLIVARQRANKIAAEAGWPVALL